MRTNMDYLCIGHFLLDKRDQKPWKETENWQEQFELD
jgi:carbamoyltransferase